VWALRAGGRGRELVEWFRECEAGKAVLTGETGPIADCGGARNVDTEKTTYYVQYSTVAPTVLHWIIRCSAVS